MFTYQSLDNIETKKLTLHFHTDMLSLVRDEISNSCYWCWVYTHLKGYFPLLCCIIFVYFNFAAKPSFKKLYICSM